MPYNLEKVTSPRSRIYQQLYNYYEFCKHTRRMTSYTMAGKVAALNSFVSFSRLNDLHKVSNRIINDWINYQALRNNSGRSINNRLAHLKALLRWQSEMNLKMPKLQLALIPIVQEYPPRKVFFTREQVQQVLACSNQLQWLLISLAFDCGLRIAELQGLRLTSVHGDYIDIIGKGQKRRYAYLSSEVKEKLQAWIDKNKIDDFLWPSPIRPDQPLAICTIRTYMQDAFRRGGFSNFCPHDLRHSYATDLKLLGISTRQIQAGLGHSTEQVTERYLSDLNGYDLAKMYQIKYKR